MRQVGAIVRGRLHVVHRDGSQSRCHVKARLDEHLREGSRRDAPR
jgi:hypothetical protein